MKILFTGISSFTGFWIANYFASKGYTIDAVLTKKNITQYDSLRIERLTRLSDNINLIFDCRFGDNKFISLIKSNQYDIIIHHASNVKDYSSNSFDWQLAINENTNNIEIVIKEISANSNAIFSYSSTVFEKGGISKDDPINKYAFSKKLSNEIIKYFCFKYGIKFTQIFISNPFGPFEDFKLNHHILTSWKSCLDFVIKTPEYIRDFIPVDLLAISYFEHIISLQITNNLIHSYSPSGYQMKIVDYVFFLSNKLKQHSGDEKNYKTENQINFSEPIKLVNETNVLSNKTWNEKEFWFKYFNYYNFI